MKILILGGSRFIGLKLIKKIVRYGWPVEIFNRGITNPKVIFPKLVKITKGDRNKQSDLKKIIDGTYDFVVDLSGYTREQIKLIKTLIKKSGHYIFISTGAIYNPNSRKKARENDQPNPYLVSGSYARNKLEAENYLKQLTDTNQATVTIFRPTYILGPENPYYREDYFLDRLIHNKPIIVNNLQVKVSFVDVEDVASAIISCILNCSLCKGQVFNLANNQTVTFGQLIKDFEKITNKQAIIKNSNFPQTETDSIFPFAPINLILDNTKIKKILKFKFIALTDTLKKSYQSYLAKSNTELIT